MDKAESLRIIRNFLNCMSKTYRARTDNATVVRDIILCGTSAAGRTSSVAYCRKIGLDPYGHTLELEDAQ